MGAVGERVPNMYIVQVGSRVPCVSGIFLFRFDQVSQGGRGWRGGSTGVARLIGGARGAGEGGGAGGAKM